MRGWPSPFNISRTHVPHILKLGLIFVESYMRTIYHASVTYSLETPKYVHVYVWVQQW